MTTDRITKNSHFINITVFIIGQKHLRTTDRTILKNTTTDRSDINDLALGENKIHGKVEGFHSVFTYKSCPTCTKRNEITGKACWNCGKIVSSYVNDFMFEVSIGNNNEAEPLVGFRKILPAQEQEVFDDVSSAENIVDLLNNLWSGKSLIISFSPSQKGDPIIESLYSDPNNN